MAGAGAAGARPRARRSARRRRPRRRGVPAPIVAARFHNGARRGATAAACAASASARGLDLSCSRAACSRTGCCSSAPPSRWSAAGLRVLRPGRCRRTTAASPTARWRSPRRARSGQPDVPEPEEHAERPEHAGSARCGRPARSPDGSAPRRRRRCRPPSRRPTSARRRPAPATASSWVGSAAIRSKTTAPDARQAVEDADRERLPRASHLACARAGRRRGGGGGARAGRVCVRDVRGSRRASTSTGRATARNRITTPTAFSAPRLEPRRQLGLEGDQRQPDRQERGGVTGAPPGAQAGSARGRRRHRRRPAR